MSERFEEDIERGGGKPKHQKVVMGKNHELHPAAQANVAETGCDPVADLAEIRRCGTTREEFLVLS